MSFYLHFGECFDIVCHSKVLSKLSRYGVSGLAYKWIEGFLLGVPQGSVLGPLLYLRYSTDLQHVVNHSTISTYADDSKLCRAIWHLEDCLLLQRHLDSISILAKDWHCN